MGIDTSIYNQLLRPPKSIAEYDAEAMAGQQNKLALQMGRAKMDEYQRGVDDEQAVRGVVSKFGADKTANYNSLLGAGRLKEAQAYEKSNADTNKTLSEASENAAQTEKVALENIGIASTFHKNQLGVVNTPEAAARWVAAAFKDPHLKFLTERMGTVEEQIAQIPRDPKAFADWKMQSSLAADKLIEYSRANANTIATNEQSNTNSLRADATSRSNNAATVGASYANAAATRAIASATRDAASIQRDQATEMKMGDDYRAQSKGFKEVGDAYKQLNATLDKATTSPAATLAGATKFMKLLDPGSVVRESELGMALAATGILDRATNYFETLKYGKVLTPAQVKDFKNITQQIYGAAQEQQRAIDGNYTKQAKAYKLRPEMVVQDLGQNATPAGAPASGAKFLGFE